MPDYKKARIYAIKSKELDFIYIGSTCEKYLSKRLSKHKYKYKQFLHGQHHFMSSFELFTNDDEYIEVLEEYPCNNNEELLQRERYHININKCVNIMMKNLDT